MSEGLGYAHEHNVVHRDVKLDNVLIGPGQYPEKVTDFGIAQLEGGSGMTQTGATMGTLAFMAPEQKLSSRRATAISDSYSVGASLYLMLTNRNPSELYAHDIQERASCRFTDRGGDVQMLPFGSQRKTSKRIRTRPSTTLYSILASGNYPRLSSFRADSKEGHAT